MKYKIKLRRSEFQAFNLLMRRYFTRLRAEHISFCIIPIYSGIIEATSSTSFDLDSKKKITKSFRPYDLEHTIVNLTSFFEINPYELEIIREISTQINAQKDTCKNLFISNYFKESKTA